MHLLALAGHQVLKAHLWPAAGSDCYPHRSATRALWKAHGRAAGRIAVGGGSARERMRN